MPEPRFQCQGCGKRYRWKPELAGRSARCPCGAVMAVPAESPATDDLYELSPGSPASRPRGTPTPVPPPARPAQAPTHAPVLDYQSKSAASAESPDKLMDFQVPLVLLVAGIAVQFLAGWWAGRAAGMGPAQAMAQVGPELLVSTTLMVLAVFLAARWRQFSFGPFWTAVLKLSAVAVAPSAAMTVSGVFLHFLPVVGGLITWAIGFCLYFALIGAFFDLDQSDTWYCVVVIFLVKLAVFLVGLMVLGK